MSSSTARRTIMAGTVLTLIASTGAAAAPAVAVAGQPAGLLLLLVGVAAGQALGYGLDADSSAWRFSPP